MAEQAQGPLGGIKALDVTMNWADFGADVIKVERPGRGDDTRRFVPVYKGESSLFIMINRNKRGVALDLYHERGKDAFRRL